LGFALRCAAANPNRKTSVSVRRVSNWAIPEL
jgi:hypothetical protein